MRIGRRALKQPGILNWQNLKSRIRQSIVRNISRCKRFKKSLRVFANPKTKFGKLIEPHCQMTCAAVEEREVVLCVGDTTFLDYGSIKVKREGYGPTGNGGNGLILHSALAIDAELGQPIGLLWQKLWNP